MQILSALLGFLVFLISLVFALSNQQSVSVSLWPFDDDITAPLYILTLGSLAVGLVLGGFFVWLTVLPHRFRARRLGKDVTLLSGKILELEREVEQHREATRARQDQQRVTAVKTPLLTGPKWRFWERF